MPVNLKVWSWKTIIMCLLQTVCHTRKNGKQKLQSVLCWHDTSICLGWSSTQHTADFQPLHDVWKHVLVFVVLYLYFICKKILYIKKKKLCFVSFMFFCRFYWDKTTVFGSSHVFLFYFIFIWLTKQTSINFWMICVQGKS